jgi:hypothetical protein
MGDATASSAERGRSIGIVLDTGGGLTRGTFRWLSRWTRRTLCERGSAPCVRMRSEPTCDGEAGATVPAWPPATRLGQEDGVCDGDMD